MKITKFQGVAPKIRPLKLADGVASDAENCLLHSGAIEPIRSMQYVNHCVAVDGKKFIGTPASLHKIGPAWLAFESVTPIAEDPLAIGGEGAFLFVQDGALYRSGYNFIVDGFGPYKVGIDRPCKPPVVTLTGEKCRDVITLPDPCPEPEATPAEPMECDQSDSAPYVLSFCYTWVTKCNEESAPSDYSEPVLVPPGEGLLLMTNDEPPENATSIRWYVLLVGEDKGSMALISENPVSQPVLNYCHQWDHGADPLITHEWLPPRCAQGVANIGYNAVMLWAGKELYPSEVRQPHAYPERFKITLDEQIVRVVSYRMGDGQYQAIALTSGCPYLISGTDPMQLKVQRLSRHLPCISAKGALVVGTMVFYVSEDGLVRVLNTGELEVITSRWFDRAWWMQYDPRSMTPAYYNNRIFLFTDNAESRSFMFSSGEQDSAYNPADLVFLSPHASAVYQDSETQLHIASETGEVYEWEGSDVYMTAIWKSQIINTNSPWTIAAGRVLLDVNDIPAEALPWVQLVWETYGRALLGSEARNFLCKYPEAEFALAYLTGNTAWVTLWGNGRKRVGRPVTSRPFRINSQGRLSQWQVEVRTTVPVYELALSNNMNTL